MEELATGIRQVLADRGIESGPLQLTRIPGGASRETWLAEGEGGRWVLRRDPRDTVSLVPISEEFALISRAVEADAPVPEPLAFEPDGGRFGSPGLLMAHVDGTSVAPRIIRKPEFEAARSVLTKQLAEALARIHSIDPATLDGVLPKPPTDPALDQIAEWERQLEEIGEPLPAVELGLRWLRANTPQPAEPRLVHGDFRLGNFIVDDAGLAAVIDWELAHLGDPAEDVGWLCIRSWRFGNDDRPVAGVGQLDEFISAYEAAGGAPIARDRVRYWEAFGNVKWAVICARQAHDHLTGVRRSHELASLGRRICEPEWDLLQLIETGGDEGGLMQDRPTASELLDSVAEYLLAELRPEVPSEQRFKVLVAANVCAVVARELSAGDEPDHEDLALFGELLGKQVDDSRAAAAELSERIRSGELDDRIDELTPRLEEHVRRKLEIARPGYEEG